MTNAFHLSDYSVDRGSARLHAVRSGGTVRQVSVGLFLLGKLPWEVLIKAAHLPGAALHLCLVLQLQRKLDQQQTVALRRKLVADLGVKIKAETRALAQLESAGLVSVARHRGRRPRVTPQWGDEGLNRSEP